jgi:hypothetical protein
MSAFNEHCSAVVKDYVQTVLIIDDQAGLRSPENAVVADIIDDLPDNNPLTQRVVSAAEGVTETGSDITTESASHQLNALELTSVFYQKGIVAGLYQPQIEDGEDVEVFAQKTEKVAATADIIILDWMLKGSDSNYSKAIVKKIIKSDISAGGRIRNIIIYTGEKNLTELKDALNAELNDENIKSAGDYQLTANSLKISFYNKPNSGGIEEREVTELDLPAKALEEFEALVDGLFPAFAMKAAATIRHNTGRIIASFDKSLDIGYLGHRALLPTPQDSELFMLENFVSYLRNILAISKVDNETLGDDIIEKWIEKNYISLNSTYSKGTDKNLVKLEFDKKSLSNILKFGTNQNSSGLYEEIKNSHINFSKTKVTPPNEQEALNLAESFANKIIKDNKIPLTFLDLFSSQDNCIELSSKKFSIMCSFKRTFRDINLELEKPYLTQGSLVFDPNKNRYFLCITPKCDTARVDGERQFSFAEMQQVDQSKKFDLVIPDFRNSEDFFYLSLVTNFYNLKHFTFDGGVSNRVIGSEKFGDIIFTSKEGSTYIWIGDLADLSTQKRVSDLVGNLNRIGVDEVEWLRRQ